MDAAWAVGAAYPGFRSLPSQPAGESGGAETGLRVLAARDIPLEMPHAEGERRTAREDPSGAHAGYPRVASGGARAL